MKSIIRKFVGAALLLALPLSFTSCEDILGKWDNPALKQAAITLKNAVDNGATVSIPYKIGDTEYTATFYKDGDNYVLQSGSGYEFLKYDSTKGWLVFTYKNPVTGDPLFDIYVDLENQSFFRIDYPLAPGATPITFDGKITVNNFSFTATNSCPKSVLITSGDFDLYVYYADGEVWNDVLGRYTKTGHIELTSDETNLLFTDGTTPMTMHYVDPTSDTPPIAGVKVAPTDEIGKQGGAAYNDKYIAKLLGGMAIG